MSLIWPKPLSSTPTPLFFFSQNSKQNVLMIEKNGEGPFNHSDHLLKIGKN